MQKHNQRTIPTKWALKLPTSILPMNASRRASGRARSFAQHRRIISICTSQAELLLQESHCMPVNKANKYSISKFNIYDFHFDLFSPVCWCVRCVLVCRYVFFFYFHAPAMSSRSAQYFWLVMNMNSSFAHSTAECSNCLFSFVLIILRSVCVPTFIAVCCLFYMDLSF